MLKQILSIQGVGLFHDAGPSPVLDRVALFYGENGRGKSTLAGVLRSCGENQAAALCPRKTLDGAKEQRVHLRFVDANGTEVEVCLDPLIGPEWSPAIPDLRIFDADFVSRNIYSGVDINTDHRASLLEFALGEEAVVLREKVDAATTKINEATAKITAQTAVVKAYAGLLSMDAFAELAEAPNADDEIVALERRIAVAGVRDTLMKKAVPAALAVPTFIAISLFTILAKSLQEVEAAADQAVRAHLEKCNHLGFEDWLSQGRTFDLGDECPYCGANTKDNGLLKAYRTYFNKEYNDLKAEVAQLERGLQARLGDEVVDRITQAFDTAKAHIDGWKGYVELEPLSFDAAAMKANLAELRAMLEPLVKTKAAQPLEPAGTPEARVQVETLWAKAIAHVDKTNKQIQTAQAEIDTYKKTLEAEDVSQLRKSMDMLKLRKLRHTAAVIEAVAQLKLLTDEKKTFMQEKESARQTLDKLMRETLGKYETEINALLHAFGAQIRIDSLGFDYRGSGVPRSDYRLKVRGQNVRLAGADGATFGNTLSEGDRRSLAFAFFVARLHQDPHLADRMVVIDDPMCSLDRRRRAATVRVLKTLAVKCKQLIVLAHDLYFLRALDDGLNALPAKTKAAVPRSYCKIMSAANDYSTFGTLNLAHECATQYEKDLELVTGYVHAKPGLEPDHVATRLRVLLEANLQRQFPQIIARDCMLGDIIRDIENAVPPSHLAGLQNGVKELRALNDYMKSFHHADDGTPPDFSTLDEGELRTYCERTLAFVFRGA